VKGDQVEPELEQDEDDAGALVFEASRFLAAERAVASFADRLDAEDFAGAGRAAAMFFVMAPLRGNDQEEEV
jgi:hypothetical protein